MWNNIYYKLKKLNRELNNSIGYIVIAFGIFILVMYIPDWLWMVLLGIIIIIIGYYINVYFK
ncbi:hypothetical protein ACETAC_07055 [Aceticella autotrophica]|uniref:Uncharacterized protein n=1 Tax=Aceticella autotrophica TaxID=2755338 RepID=A0A975G9S3_9THEO|nr:hypothetical protein [Aceticella autotrophica]MDI6604659.1 hypothetical protein [Thermoanaerobacteraceae bacterium]QSZ26666.1 hypothetical protein ACETAC_07055 [Aceticella autotrophica]